jgi:predicted AlkP superfamily phosphohydrolase/phosphomutase
MQRTLVLGLDSVPQGFMFEKFLPWMPNVRKLLGKSRYGTLLSTDPPITVPAWAVMFSGVDPGTLGIYGFRHRKLGSYDEMYTPSSEMLPYPLLWDLLSRRGHRVAVVGMPPGYPPPHVNGVYISDFLTPDNATDFVYPESYRAEIQRTAKGEYMFDVTFRAEDRDRVEREVFEMTRRRFAVARELWRKERWDLFAVHEIGPDRIHHAFWKFFDPTHPKYVTGSPFNSTAERYYKLLDEEIAQFLELVPDDVAVWIASDHGSQAMEGCFCINEWLIRNGYLTLAGPRPAPGTPLDAVPIDWGRTRIWGAGGYYARLFINVKGREPKGTVAPGDVPALIRELDDGLRKVVGPDGKPLGVEILDPHRVYRSVRGDPPDLMAYFRDLRWRSAGTIGYEGLFLAENDTGPDDSVHSMDGFFMLYSPEDGKPAGRLPDQSILDVAPTFMQRMGLPIPPHVQGKPIVDLLRE